MLFIFMRNFPLQLQPNVKVLCGWLHILEVTLTYLGPEIGYFHWDIL